MSNERFEGLADGFLVLEARGGDREAFRLLTERWQERLWRQARRVTRREDLAWDATQETWLAIVGSLEHLQDPARFGAWALSIVTRRALDVLRRGSRLEPLPESGEPVLQEGPNPGDERLERMRDAIDSLPAEQRALLSLHHAEGVALEDIAEHLAVPLGTVKSRLHTARERLRAIVERKHHA